MSVARFAVTRRVTVAVMACAIVVLGLFALPRLAVALLPSFQPPIVSVTVSYPNVSPETIESQVTRPIENAVSRVNGIDILNSESFQGTSQVRAQFHYGVDINAAAVDVQQQVARIRNALPNDPNLQEPQIAKADPNALPVMRLYVTDSLRTQRDLSDLITNTLADQFGSIDGVAAVSVTGGQTRGLIVEPDAATLAGYDMSADQLVSRIKEENVNLPAGIAQVGKNEYEIRADSLYKSAAELGGTIMTMRNGAPVYLRDVARVTDGITEQRIFTRVDDNNGQHPAVAMFVNAQPDANIVQVAYGVQAKIREISRRYPSMTFSLTFDQREFIEDSIKALEHTALYGAALAVLIILLFLHSWRSTLIVAVSLPVSILGTLFAAFLFHQTLNTMTLGGLALAVGLIVDDAIVVIENIYRHMAEGQSILEAAESATAQILSAVLASSITVITVFFPLLLIPGLQGLIFGPFALMVMCAVAISLLVALTTVPMLSTRLLGNERAHGATENGKPAGPYARFCAAFDRGYEKLAARYRALLAWSIDRPAIVVGTAFGILALTMLLVKLGVVSTELFPATNSRFLRAFVQTPVGTSLAETNRLSQIVEGRLRADKRVVAIGDSVGFTFGGGARAVSNRSVLSITLRPGTTSEGAGRFVQEWQYRLGGSPGRAGGTLGRAFFATAKREPIPGVTIRLFTIDILQQQISQGQDALQVQIYGNDVTQLYKLAHQAIPAIAQIPGVGTPDTNVTDAQPELDVKIDRTRAQHLGLSTAQISQALDTATNGSIASYFQINGTEYPIQVILPPAQRRSFQSLHDLLLSPNTPAAAGAGLGSAIPLREVATIRFGNGPSQISRQGKQRKIDITAPLLGTTLGDAVTAAQGIMDRFPLPSGYYWQFGPAVKQQADTFGGLALVVGLAVVLIYMLLAAQFESYLHPLVIMMSVPLSFTGVVLSLMISHRAFGLTAFIGTLMLVGIVVKNAILVVEFTNQLRRQGQPVREALLHAAPLRLRPILMTSLATIGGMLPLALGIENGSETQAPLGTVVIGGLITSTLLSLVVVPTIYRWTATTIETRFHPKPPKPAFGRTRNPEPLVGTPAD